MRKNNTQSTNQQPIGTSSIQIRGTKPHSKTDTQSTRLLYGRYLRNKIITLPPYSPQPVILRGAKGEVAESILSTKNPRPPGEEGLTQTMAEGPGSAFIHHPSSALTGTFSQGRRFFLCFEMWMLQVRGNPVQTTDALGIESPGEE
ncbi:MAG: hypothetical protein VXV73_05735 [Actinomycetota bacterium]|nr:hypothetical protein [Actinomycetota bacterium]